MGAVIGLTGAVTCSLFAGLLAAISHSNPFGDYGMSFPRGVATYFGTFVAAGVVGGSIARVGRSTFGVMCIGAVCGAICYIGFSIGENGIRFWGPGELFVLTGCALTGAIIAPFARRGMRRGAAIGAAVKQQRIDRQSRSSER
jgi:hypothetical protein